MTRILTMTALLAMAACGSDAPDRLGTTDRGDAGEVDAAVDVRAADAAAADVGGVYAGAASAERRVVYVDVRRPDEYATGHVVGAIHIPHTEMSERMSELDEYRDADIILYCRTGNRSAIAQQILEQAGFEHLHNGGALTDLERQGVPTTR